MRKLWFFILILLAAWFVYGDKVVPLPGINNPNTISVNSELLAVTEDTTFYLYSLKDISLIKKYGQHDVFIHYSQSQVVPINRR